MGFLNDLGNIVGDIVNESLNQFAAGLEEERRKQEEEQTQMVLDKINSMIDDFKSIYDHIEQIKSEVCQSGNIEKLLMPSVRIAAVFGNDWELLCKAFSPEDEEKERFNHAVEEIQEDIELMDSLFSDFSQADEGEVEQYTEIKMKNVSDVFHKKIKLLYTNLDYFSDQKILQKNVEAVTAFNSYLFSEIQNLNTFLLDAYDEMLEI